MEYLSMLTRYQQLGMNQGRYQTQQHHHQQQRRIANGKDEQREIIDVCGHLRSIQNRKHLSAWQRHPLG